MAGFVSARERRLWTWAAVVVVTVLATLGLARSLAETLRARGVLDGLFAAGAALFLVALVAVALRARPRGLELGVAFAVAAVYLMSFARLGITEERTHLLEYGVVALLVHEALLERADGRQWQRPRLAPAALAFALTTMVGALDEVVQGILPSRVFDVRDLGFNALAALLAVTGRAALAWAARHARPRPG